MKALPEPLEIEVFWSGPEDCYIAAVHSLDADGNLHAEGNTQAQALWGLAAVIARWLREKE